MQRNNEQTFDKILNGATVPVHIIKIIFSSLMISSTGMQSYQIHRLHSNVTFPVVI